MAVAVIMPRLGQSVESCIINKWFKKKGNKVKEGEILFSYETDKASFEAEAPASGTLLEIFFHEDEEVPVLSNVAVIGQEGESIDVFRPTTDNSTFSEMVSKVEKTTNTENQYKTGQQHTATYIKEDVLNNKTKISPRAKRIARKIGVPYKGLHGSGPLGRIIERDVEAASEDGLLATRLALEKAKEQGFTIRNQGTGLGGRILSTDLDKAFQSIDDVKIKKISNIRKIISKNVYGSLQNTAQLTIHISADASKLLAYRKLIKAGLAKGIGINITINDIVCYSVTKILSLFPEVNSHFMGDTIKTFKHVHLGIAVHTERGLMVPTIRNADLLKIENLADSIKNAADKCRQGNLDPDLLTMATFTVTNLGVYGIEMFTPILNPPQIAILGVNTITYRPVDAGNGIIGMVPYIGLSLTFDHRALDGAPAAIFLKALKDEIENLKIA